jgi:hypothetical protein
VVIVGVHRRWFRISGGNVHHPKPFEAMGVISCEMSPSTVLDYFGTNPKPFESMRVRSHEMSPSMLLDCFGANPIPFEAMGRGVME